MVGAKVKTRPVASAQPRLVIHVPSAMLNRYGQDGFGLYARIAPEFRRRGLEVEFVERPSTTELAAYTKQDFHLVHHGFLRRFNVLNCGIAYIWPYWYLDQRGVLCDSSLARANPSLEAISPSRATRFLEGLRARMIETGLSKYDQPARQGAVARDHIAVFLQGMSGPVIRSMYMLETEMLDLVVRLREGREVLIKSHPKWPDTVASEHARLLAQRHEAVRIVDANVHDLLEGAYCSVSICSGASFEGFFHRTPAVLFGHSDFAACAWTVRTAKEAERALEEIGDVAFDYERFLYWFLRRKMFSVRNPNVAARVQQRIERTGFDLALEQEARPDLFHEVRSEVPTVDRLTPSVEGNKSASKTKEGI